MNCSIKKLHLCHVLPTNNKTCHQIHRSLINPPHHHCQHLHAIPSTTPPSFHHVANAIILHVHDQNLTSQRLLLHNYFTPTPTQTYTPFHIPCICPSIMPHYLPYAISSKPADILPFPTYKFHPTPSLRVQIVPMDSKLQHLTIIHLFVHQL